MKKLLTVFAFLTLVLALVACQTKTFTVTFDTDGGPNVPAQTVEDGKKATEPSEPSKTGYVFDGWYKESTFTTEWLFDTMVVKSDLTLYAKYTLDGPTDVQKVDSVHSMLDLGDISALTNQSPRLTLATQRDGVSISWHIDKTDYIAVNGVVSQPEAEVGDQVVKLTATLTLNSVTKEKVFNAIVLALPDVTEAPLLIDETFDYTNGLIQESVTPWAPVSGKTGTSLYTVVDSIPGVMLPEGSKALKVEALTETQLEASITHSYAVVVVEMDVMQTAASNGSAVHIQTSASSPAIGFGIDGRDIYYRVDNVQHKIYQVELNTWHTLRLEVDLVNQTFEVFYYSLEGQLVQVTPGKVSYTTVTSMTQLFLRTGSSTTTELRAPAYVTNIRANRIESMPRPEELVFLGEVEGIESSVSIEQDQPFTPSIPKVYNLFGEQRLLVLDTDYSLVVTNPVNTAIAGEYNVVYTFTNKSNEADVVEVTQVVTVYSKAQPNEITEVTMEEIPYKESLTTVTVNLLQPNGTLYYLFSDNEVESIETIKTGSSVEVTSLTVTLEEINPNAMDYIHVYVSLNGDSNVVSQVVNYEEVVYLSTPQEFYDITTSTGDQPTYVLLNDIDFEGFTWTAVNGSFKGKLYGEGFVIRNVSITISGNSIYGGIFSRTNGATIKDLVLDHITISGSTTRSGLLTGRNENTASVFENITIKNSSLIGGDSNGVGGLVGLVSKDLMISNIAIINTTVHAEAVKNVGAVVGRVDGATLSASDIFVDGVTVSSNATGGDVAVGGVVGYIRDSATSIANLDRVVVLNTILDGQVAGAAIGYVRAAGSATAENLYLEVEFRNAVGAGLLGRINDEVSKLTQTTIYGSLTNAMTGTAVQDLANTVIPTSDSWWTENLSAFTTSDLWTVNPDGSIILNLVIVEEKVFVEVSFENDVTISPISVEVGNTLILPEEPTKDGFTFEGWFTDVQLLTPFEETTPILQATILYAKWTEIQAPIYIVTFEVNEGSSVDPQQVIENELAVIPSEPSKPLFVFGGWYLDVSLENPFDFQTEITASITLYAKWIEEMTVSFVTEGSSVTDVKVAKGLTIDSPTTSKGFYDFVGWYLEDSFTTEFSFDTEITTNLTLYAKFVEQTPTVILTAQAFVDMLNSPEEREYHLGADLDLTGLSHTPTVFKGILDGKGFTISNFTFNGEGRGGLFTYFRGSAMNLVFDNAQVTSLNDRAGIIGGEVDALGVVVENIKIINSSVNANHDNGAGGLFGLVTDGKGELTARNIEIIDLTVTNLKKNSGGLVGYVRGIGDTIVEDIYLNNVTITATEGAGGLFGYVNNPKSAVVNRALLIDLSVTVSPNYGAFISGRVPDSNILSVTDVVILNSSVTGTRYLGEVNGRYTKTIQTNVFAQNSTLTGRADEGQQATLIDLETVVDIAWFNTNVPNFGLNGWDMTGFLPVLN
ncbi:hypothetical protein, Listeria/Bacterioides repeat [Paracholeplasma brassicae]|uniref:Atrophied bacterial Ig domain-containing protein n=1 Tax=Acholeplasma brassicae TaxID=61635 RepID=U4KSP7_9MOLU|nr:InlB B-repeat-containing protein [Paracholeplasma brassicae]CCV65309.1 hypothetical protein, Listeria/Bacterioides repeat [Paracholeplasma brassicae]